MIYIITGYVCLVILLILLYHRYFEFRVKSANENKDLIEKYEAQINELRQSSEKILIESKLSSDKANDALSELNILRKEKESEIKLRLNAEKQVEMAMQKTEDMEDRINDWNESQQAVMQDAMEAIYKVGNDLYKKLNQSYKVETDATKNLLGKFTKDISNHFTDGAKISSPTKSPQKTQGEGDMSGSVATRKIVTGIVDTIESSGLIVSRDYFLPQNFDDKLASLVLCELVFLKKNILHFIDFKVVRYFDEYKILKAKDQNFAKENLKKRLDKYLAYLANPKYNQSILKALASRKIKHDKIINVFYVQDSSELALLKEIGYQEKAQELKLKIVDSNSINNIIL